MTDTLDDSYGPVVDSEPTQPMDLGEIVHVCVCGSQLWNVMVMFEDYEIAMYFTEMTCAVCGSKAIAPTLCDRPEGMYKDGNDY